MYNYTTERPYVFTDEGQRKFVKIYDTAKKAFETTGAVTAGKLMTGCSGDSWQTMACVDRLIEIGSAREVNTSGAWQYKVFLPVHYD